ncbi:cation:proton antiporter [Micrococcus sp. TA1]|uniref:cation:proton antiporter domain-containing protein n=1 Tax=Micrococcus sp. TA1 TaxID=681627 RepID=UPI00183B9A9C|nr:NhaP-type Na+/H+ or K+/H+ antiporter [Micrococcus sp. TA1]
MGDGSGAAGAGLPLLLVGTVMVYALICRWLERVGITAAMVFVAVGVLVGSAGFGLVAVDPQAHWFLVVAEVTLSLLLFCDAARLSPRKVGGDLGPVLRLLGIGLPLTIITGTVLVITVFPERGWVAAALVAAILAPTDAALGAAVVSDERVPVRVRRILGMESGLNDGLATPVVSVLIAVTASQAGIAGGESWQVRAVYSLGVGVAVGAGVGFGGGLVLRWCRRREWTSPLSVQVAVLTLASVCYFGATSIEANGFVAAFLGGLAFTTATGMRAAEEELAFTETLGVLASQVVWLLFGAAMVGPALARMTTETVLVALGALTVARMVPVAVAMVGSRWSPATIVFVGWFGPRGLATVIFALVALQSLGTTGLADHVLDVAAVTVLVSIVAHGLSAGPLAIRYGTWAAGLSANAPEHVQVAPASRRRLGLHR